MEQNQSTKAREWGDIFSEWRQSGESRRGYCQRTGISISAFGYWYRKLEGEGPEQSLVKVGSAKVLAGVSGNGLTARVGGISVELSGQESEEVLTKIFRALKGIS